jgi:excisionase family DNA binding protein
VTAARRPVPLLHAKDPGKWLTPGEVAAQLRVGKMSVYRKIHSGELVAARIGRTYRITARDLADYLNRARGAQ